MSLQSRILRDYRSLHPRHTLRETSIQLDIQLTRVFRIYNGAPMKLEEYERFHEAVYGAGASTGFEGSFRRVTEALARNLAPGELTKVTAILERQLHWHNLRNDGKTLETHQTASIA